MNDKNAAGKGKENTPPATGAPPLNPNEQAAAKKTYNRKPKEGLTVSFQITDPTEIEMLKTLADHDSRDTSNMAKHLHRQIVKVKHAEHLKVQEGT